MNDDFLTLCVQNVVDEMRRGAEQYGKYASTHEAYAVIREELDEMWDAIKHNAPLHVTNEAMQVAATALRFYAELRELEEQGHE